MEREVLEFDVQFVGAGPAGLAGAIHLANLISAHNEKCAATGTTPNQLAASTAQHAETLADIGELVFAQWAGLLSARDA